MSTDQTGTDVDADHNHTNPAYPVSCPTSSRCHLALFQPVYPPRSPTCSRSSRLSSCARIPCRARRGLRSSSLLRLLILSPFLILSCTGTDTRTGMSTSYEQIYSINYIFSFYRFVVPASPLNPYLIVASYVACLLHPTQMRILSFDNPRLASISDPARSTLIPLARTRTRVASRRFDSARRACVRYWYAGARVCSP